LRFEAKGGFQVPRVQGKWELCHNSAATAFSVAKVWLHKKNLNFLKTFSNFNIIYLFLFLVFLVFFILTTTSCSFIASEVARGTRLKQPSPCLKSHIMLALGLSTSKHFWA